MGWWAVIVRISVLVTVVAAFLTLSEFKSHRETVIAVLSNDVFLWIGYGTSSEQSHGVISSDLHSIIRRGSDDRLFTREELQMHDGSLAGKALYLAVLGSVYDVSAGSKHYGPGGGYSFFTGKDGCRAFVTGDFSESGLTDDVSDFTSAQWLDLLHWHKFYGTSYTYVGKIVGRYYDASGGPTAALLASQVSVDEALAEKDKDDALQQIFPPCNSHWSSSDGSRVWCSTNSGGISREWDGVPRKFFDKTTQTTRCVCVRTSGPPSDTSRPDLHNGDLGHPSLREYDNCPSLSVLCQLT